MISRRRWRSLRHPICRIITVKLCRQKTNEKIVIESVEVGDAANAKTNIKINIKQNDMKNDMHLDFNLIYKSIKKRLSNEVENAYSKKIYENTICFKFHS